MYRNRESDDRPRAAVDMMTSVDSQQNPTVPFHNSAEVFSRRFVSNGNLDDSGGLLIGWMIEVHRKAALHGFIEVLKKLLEGLSLSCAAGNGGNRGPIALPPPPGSEPSPSLLAPFAWHTRLTRCVQ